MRLLRSVGFGCLVGFACLSFGLWVASLLVETEDVRPVETPAVAQPGAPTVQVPEGFSVGFGAEVEEQVSIPYLLPGWGIAVVGATIWWYRRSGRRA